MNKNYIYSISLDGMVLKTVECNGKTYSWNDIDCVYYNDNGDENDYLMLDERYIILED